MPSAAYQRVVAHLDSLFETSSHDPGDIRATVALSRELIRRYAMVGGQSPRLRADTRIQPTLADGVPAEWVLATGSDSERRLCWFHGGAWISGEAADYRHVAEYLSRALRASVLSLNYRRAPECPFPAALHDCHRAYYWLRDHGPNGAEQGQRLWLAGDSAGANLVLALLLRLRDGRQPMPSSAATIGAVTDLTGSGDSMRTRAGVDNVISRGGLAYVSALYVQDHTPLTDPLVSPLYGQLNDLPPLRMHVGGRESLQDDTIRFAERAREMGSPVVAKVWPDMVHCFEVFCHILPEARESLAEISEFLLKH